MIGRRSFIAGALGLPFLQLDAFAQVRGRVLVVGGGFGGASAARALKQISPTLDVILIEPKTSYIACPFSNLVLGGVRSLQAQSFSYDRLLADGVTHVQGFATEIDPIARTVAVESSDEVLSYDRLILSPGIDLRWDALEGYNQAASELMPHAWQAGPQTGLLLKQLNGMEDGGTVVMSVPAAPYRCPPGPYERASLIAHYLKTTKPRSKLLILDTKDAFSKQALFEQAWEELYGDLIEWRSASNDGGVRRVEANTLTLETDFESVKADVANVIPPQKAALIAHRAGVTDATGWCPIDATSFESKLQTGVHIIGDASIAAPMPKSAFSANLQGKACAIQVARLLAGLQAEPTVLANTCYSYTSPERAISISGVYENKDGVFSSVPGSGGVSALQPVAGERSREALQAADWFVAITGEAFG